MRRIFPSTPRGARVADDPELEGIDHRIYIDTSARAKEKPPMRTLGLAILLFSQSQSVAGRARVLINNVPMADQAIEEREVAPAVWIPTESLGAVVRHGRSSSSTSSRPTSPSTSPFTTTPRVSNLTDDDEAQLTALVQARVDAFKPDFSAIYKVVQQAKPDARIADIRKAKCLDAAYAAGVRMTAPTGDQLQFVTTGQPEVIIQRTSGELFATDPKAFAKLKGDEAKMCAGMTLGMAFPARLIVVKGPDGTWSAPF